MGRTSKNLIKVSILAALVAFFWPRDDSSLRTPASISKDAGKIRSGSAVSVKIPCSKGQKVIKRQTHFPYVRVFGTRCLTHNREKLESIEIINRTNGYQAATFHVGKKDYTSDLIRLADGQNEIQIVQNFKSGETEFFSLFVNNAKTSPPK